MDIRDPIEIIDVYDGGEPPKIRTIRYYIIALAIVLFIFIFYISYELYKRQVTRMITFTLPSTAELYYKKDLLKGLKQPNGDAVLYSYRFPYGRHTLTVIDSNHKKYLLQFELKENIDQPKGFIFNKGTFISF